MSQQTQNKPNQESRTKGLLKAAANGAALGLFMGTMVGSTILVSRAIAGQFSNK